MDLIITKKKIFRFSFVYLCIYLLFGCYFALNSLVVVVVNTNTKIYNSFIILFVFFRFFTINIPDLLLLILFFFKLIWFFRQCRHRFEKIHTTNFFKYILSIMLSLCLPKCLFYFILLLTFIFI